MKASKISKAVQHLLELGIATEDRRLTGTGLAFDGPCSLTQVVVSSDGTGETEGRIYDGVNARGEVKMDIRVLNKDMKVIYFPTPLTFAFGIYFTAGKNVQDIVFQYTAPRL